MMIKLMSVWPLRRCSSSFWNLLLLATTTLFLLLTPTPTYAYLRYNEIQQKNSHNSYERQEGLLDQMIYSHLRTVEIDSHLGFAAGLFNVYHDAGYFQSYSSFNRLRDGVALLLEFHELFPHHHVVTVFMDLKGGLSGELHSADDFDAIIGQLPLWTPSEAQGNTSSIKEGIDVNGWPEIEDLRGRFLWCLTHGQKDYCDTDEECQSRKSFVATSITSVAEIGQQSHVVFYNQNSNHGDVGPAIYERGYIGRVFDSSDINTLEKWDLNTARQFQHVATDRINFHRDTFSKSHNDYGYPFQTLNGVDVSDFSATDEGASIMYIMADETGDAWGRRDDLHFVYNEGVERLGIDNTMNGDWIDYTASISVVNSHCDAFAKAGIMLREEDARFPLGSGQYFAVMRGCREMPRVQYRERAYMLTVAKRPTPNLSDGIETAKRIGLKVRYRYDGKDSYCEGYYKLEGRTKNDPDRYVLIEKYVFPDTKLTLHGLFASSHYWEGNEDGTYFKALFVNAQRNNVTITAQDFDKQVGGTPDMFGDGYYPPPKNDNDNASNNNRQLRKKE